MSTAPAIARSMTAGIYLRLRREAQRITIVEAARAYAVGACDEATAERLLTEAEADLVNLGEPGLRRLQTVFRFDALIYLALVQGDVPVSDICIGCGCTWNDACLGGCAWANKAKTVCTSCAENGRAS